MIKYNKGVRTVYDDDGKEIVIPPSDYDYKSFRQWILYVLIAIPVWYVLGIVVEIGYSLFLSKIVGLITGEQGFSIFELPGLF